MRRFLALLLCCIPLPAWAQRTDPQLWLSTTGSAPVGDGVRVTAEAIGRFSDRAGGFFHEEWGGLVSLAASDKVEVAIGYRHVEDWDHGRELPSEERLREQVTADLGSGFIARLRAEQRFYAGGDRVGWRVRPMVRLNVPLGPRHLSAFLVHEDFWNLNGTDWGQHGGYERMRNTVGLSLPLGKRLTTEAGYLNQYRFGRRSARDQMDNVATLSLALRL